MWNKSENQAVLTPQTDVVALTRYASKKGTDIRFIEMMPVGEGHTNGVEPYEKVIGALFRNIWNSLPYRY